MHVQSTSIATIISATSPDGGGGGGGGGSVNLIYGTYDTSSLGLVDIEAFGGNGGFASMSGASYGGGGGGGYVNVQSCEVVCSSGSSLCTSAPLINSIGNNFGNEGTPNSSNTGNSNNFRKGHRCENN